MKKRKLWIFAVTAAVLSGCGGKTESVEMTPIETAVEIATEASTEAGKEEADLSSIAGLLGMQDQETEDLLGGGEENWSADHSLYIGRIFQAGLFGESYPVYTTCDRDRVVDSVSIHVVSGERKVTEEEVEQWRNRISDYMGISGTEENRMSEGGSSQITWRKDGEIVTLHYMEDNLSISFQKLAAELDEGAADGERESEQVTTESQGIDNFDVDLSEAEEFAVQIKDAVAAADLEGLADLTAFPVYIGFPEGGQFVESREDFISLGKEKIFTEELTASVSRADETGLSPSMAGFVLSEETGGANIVFGLRDGELAVVGINY